MSSQNDCSVTTGADVKLFYAVDYCGCDMPEGPFTVAELNAGSRSFNENTETVQAPNAYDRTCTRTFTSGGTATNPFDLCLGTNNDLMDAAIGGSQSSAIEFSDTMSVTDEQTYALSNQSFEDLGFVPGMTIEVTGFANANNNGFKVICTVDGNTATVISCDCDDYNPELVVEAGVTATLSAGFMTLSGNEQPRVALYRHFPDTYNTRTNENGLVQVGYGGVITAGNLTLNPGTFANGSFTINTSSFDRCSDEDLPMVQEGDCECEQKVFIDPRNGCAVEYFFGCQQICVTSFDFTISRNLDSKTTNCGISNTAGSPSIGFTFEVALEDTSYLCRDNECNPDQNNTLLIRVKDCDPCSGEVDGYTSFVFPNVSLDSIAIDPAADSCLTQTITGTANTDNNLDAVMFIQRSNKNSNTIRNRYCASVTGPDASFIVDVAAGEVITVDWGDGTTEDFVSTGATTVSHTYADAENYNLSIVAENTFEPITAVSVVAPTILLTQDLCFLSRQATEYTFAPAAGSMSAVELDLSGMVCLETITATFDGLREVNIDNSCALLNVSITNSALTQETVQGIVEALVDCAGFGGTLDLSGGTSAAPNAATAVLIATLQARGWTVTTN